jgi:hypothetical protein
MSKEIWKPVPSKPEIMASSWGRIKLPNSTAPMPNGSFREYKTKPVFGTKTKARKTARHEYMGIYSKRFGNLKVHRLVCEAFHGPPPSPKAVVIHLNEIGTDNRAKNLKWGTQKENLNMPGFIEYCKSRTGEDNPRVKGMKA